MNLVIQRPNDGIHRSTEVSEALESDHKCVITQLNVTVTPPAPVYRVVRNLHAVNRAAFNEDRQAELGNPTDPTADQLNTILRTVLDKHAPASGRRLSTRKPSPWFSLLGCDLLAAKRERPKQSDGSDPLDVPFTGKLNILLQLSFRRLNHYFTILGLQKPSPPKNCITPLTASQPEPNAHNFQPTIFPLSDLPNLFSEFFQSKISKIRSDHDSQSCASHPLGKPFGGVPLPSFTSVSDKIVREILNKSAPNTCDLDPIPSSLLFECLDTMLPTPTAVINKSLTSGIFFKVYKAAIVKPVLKKSSLDHNDLKNCRPVSNLSFVSKIIEKVILSQLFSHLSTYQLFSPFQFAYRTGHSTETALLKVLTMRTYLF